jgi:hypothetical protein
MQTHCALQTWSGVLDADDMQRPPRPPSLLDHHHTIRESINTADTSLRHDTETRAQALWHSALNAVFTYLSQEFLRLSEFITNSKTSGKKEISEEGW